MDWLKRIVDEIIEKRKGKAFVVASGLTTSGPAHLGTLSEFIYPYSIVKELRRRGYEAEYVFVADIMDAFDDIPQSLKDKEEELKKYLGRPLAEVPDPYGCHESYGEHFLAEFLELMDKFGIKPDEVLKASELYKEGWYDDYLRLFVKERDRVKKIMEETAMRKLPENWWGFIKPVCERCGRIDKTEVTGVEGDKIRYKCKACGHEGVVDVKSHRWKLAWRLDWPSRQDFLGVDAEGGGVDHFTKGGSWDTAKRIHKEIFGKEPPVGFRYGFVLMNGKKMSKSKGIGALHEIMALLHPAVILYFILKHDIKENKNFKVEPKFLLMLYEEYRRVALGEDKDPKRRKAWELSGAKVWKAGFADLLVYYQIYRDWEKVKELTGDSQAVEDLKEYVEEWIKRDFVPEEYKVEIKQGKVEDERGCEFLKRLAGRLNEEMDAVEIHNTIYEVAKEIGISAKDAFKYVYKALLDKDRGPRAGRLVKAIGVVRAIEMFLKACEA